MKSFALAVFVKFFMMVYFTGFKNLTFLFKEVTNFMNLFMQVSDF